MQKIDSGFFSLTSLQLAPKNLTYAKIYFVWVVMALAFSLSLQGSDKIREKGGRTLPHAELQSCVLSL